MSNNSKAFRIPALQKLGTQQQSLTSLSDDLSILIMKNLEKPASRSYASPAIPAKRPHDSLIVKSEPTSDANKFHKRSGSREAQSLANNTTPAWQKSIKTESRKEDEKSTSDRSSAVTSNSRIQSCVQWHPSAAFVKFNPYSSFSSSSDIISICDSDYSETESHDSESDDDSEHKDDVDARNSQEEALLPPNDDIDPTKSFMEFMDSANRSKIHKRKPKTDISNHCTACKWKLKKCSQPGGPGPCEQCKQLSEIRGHTVRCIYEPDFVRTRAITAGIRMPEEYFSRPPNTSKRQRLSPPESVDGSVSEGRRASTSMDPPERPAKRPVKRLSQTESVPPSPVSATTSSQTSNGRLTPSSSASTQSSAEGPSGGPNETIASSSKIASTGPISTTSQEAVTTTNSMIPMQPGPMQKIADELKSQISFCKTLKEASREGEAVYELATVNIVSWGNILHSEDMKKHLALETVISKGDVPDGLKKSFLESNVEDFKKKCTWSLWE